jgi:K+-sensing histidine kinase KdpD
MTTVNAANLLSVRDYFRTSNLTALSELGRAWMAGTVDSVAGAVLARQGVGPLAQRPTVLAGVSGSEWGTNVRRAALLSFPAPQWTRCAPGK